MCAPLIKATLTKYGNQALGVTAIFIANGLLKLWIYTAARFEKHHSVVSIQGKGVQEYRNTGIARVFCTRKSTMV